MAGFQLPNYNQSSATGSFLDSGTSSNMSSLLNFGDSNGGNGNGLRFGETSNYLPDYLKLGSDRGFSWFGDANSPGQFGNVVNGALGAGKLFMGMQQYGLAKEQLAQAKEQYAKNYAAQKSMTNSALSDRQVARNAAGPGYQDTAGYMSQYGIV